MILATYGLKNELDMARFRVAFMNVANINCRLSHFHIAS